MVHNAPEVPVRAEMLQTREALIRRTLSLGAGSLCSNAPPVVIEVLRQYCRPGQNPQTPRIKCVAVRGYPVSAGFDPSRVGQTPQCGVRPTVGRSTTVGRTALKGGLAHPTVVVPLYRTASQSYALISSPDQPRP